MGVLTCVFPLALQLFVNEDAVGDTTPILVFTSSFDVTTDLDATVPDFEERLKSFPFFEIKNTSFCALSSLEIKNTSFCALSSLEISVARSCCSSSTSLINELPTLLLSSSSS
jgi:hypothetical protein